LPGGKVGGIGDVVRDLPRALAELGLPQLIVCPGYGIFGAIEGARKTAELKFPFGSSVQTVDVIEIPGPDPRIRHIAFENALFSPLGPGKIYCDDGAARPFASDAGKFVLLSAAAAQFVSNLDTKPQAVHLHDWHAAMYLLLRKFEPRFAPLRDVRTVYTIHNLALQGIRPIDHDESSLKAWFPWLHYEHTTVVDPRYSDCINPMAIGIRLADKVGTVSPTYAEEILRPSNPAQGFHGGEGLESDLAAAARDSRLSGILNGCEYPKRDRRRPGWRRTLDTIRKELLAWRRRKDALETLHNDAIARLESLPARRPANVLTSIGRLTEQKASLFLQPLADGRSALEAILERVGKKGVLILLGSGDPVLQQRMAVIAREHQNFLFLCGYSETFSDMLYAGGDLFLMPSSFEPCGISQMLAMRSGQPCVVHAVGGLKDTVVDGFNGFTFDGATPEEQAKNFVASVVTALITRKNNQDRWLKIRQNAEAERFSWQAAANRYKNDLYALADD
jgi:starch synthase